MALNRLGDLRYPKKDSNTGYKRKTILGDENVPEKNSVSEISWVVYIQDEMDFLLLQYWLRDLWSNVFAS